MGREEEILERARELRERAEEAIRFLDENADEPWAAGPLGQMLRDIAEAIIRIAEAVELLLEPPTEERVERALELIAEAWALALAAILELLLVKKVEVKRKQNGDDSPPTQEEIEAAREEAEKMREEFEKLLEEVKKEGPLTEVEHVLKLLEKFLKYLDKIIELAEELASIDPDNELAKNILEAAKKLKELFEKLIEELKKSPEWLLVLAETVLEAAETLYDLIVKPALEAYKAGSGHHHHHH
uniref:De novo designed soluble GPCR-like protein n=1 Tax=synthetic construct TaxID=32630 RepID=UPI00292A5DEC|nr:Chain A, De novo designed soluble GPCR-like protein [synthetic construct]8OYX_B Chain B, De novo designed soluble GPCR-like protein [synthetic construct]